MRLLATFALLWGAFAHAAAPPPDPALERELLVLSNEARTARGLPSLAANETLALAARRHALEMAALDYFSHTSPVQGHATLGARVADAGGAVQVLGENLALVGARDAARRSVEGWLESPGHRDNLLEPRFNQVGFGSAEGDDGRVYVVQVLAYEPVPLQGANVRSVLREEEGLEAQIVLAEEAEVALFYGDRATPAERLSAGTHTLYVETDPSETLHLRLGVRAGSSGGFILQDDGWIGEEGTWQPSGSAPQEGARIEGVRRERRTKRLYEARLTFEAPPPEDLGAWRGEAFLEPTIQGDVLTALLPSSDESVTLSVGEPVGGGRYTLLYSFTLNTASGVPQLVPTSREGGQ